MNGFARWARPYLLGLLTTVFVLSLLLWHLGSATSGLGPQEYISRQSSQNLSGILQQAVNTPYHLLQHAFLNIFLVDKTSLRISSVLISLLIFVCVFRLLYKWFGKLASFFGGLIFISTPWIILLARSGSADIMLLWPIVMLASFLEVSSAKRFKSFFWILFCITVTIGLYIPGIIWLVTVAGILARKRIVAVFNHIKGPGLFAGLVLGALILAPLIQALINHPSYLKVLLLIPSGWPHGLEIVRSIDWSASSLIWSTRGHVDIGVDRLPILNILQIALSIFGVYALSAKARRITYFLLGSMLFAIIAAGINESPILLTLGLPAIAVFIGAGVRYLFLEWHRVFPLNPFAKALSISLIGIVVLAQLIYGVSYSLIAWPHTSDTKSIYVLK